MTWTNPATATDPIDIGVLRLEGAASPPYLELGVEPLPSAMLVPADSSSDGNYYLAIGFPSTKSKANKQTKIVRAAPYANFGPAKPVAQYASLGLDPRHHLAIAFHRKRVFTAKGRVEKFPEPSGMSGSPVFLIYHNNKSAVRRGRFPVAGILIEYRKTVQLLVATDIAVALVLMDLSLND